jgi:hypothetical protein
MQTFAPHPQLQACMHDVGGEVLHGSCKAVLLTVKQRCGSGWYRLHVTFSQTIIHALVIYVWLTCHPPLFNLHTYAILWMKSSAFISALISNCNVISWIPDASKTTSSE